MNIIRKRLRSGQYKFISANDLISVNIEGRGPELLLADGSSLIFASDAQYYTIISDSSIYTLPGQIIDMDTLNLKYGCKSDDVVFDDIIEVQEFIINGSSMYRLIRN